jgi:hypothetical protein
VWNQFPVGEAGEAAGRDGEARLNGRHTLAVTVAMGLDRHEATAGTQQRHSIAQATQNRHALATQDISDEGCIARLGEDQVE